MRLCVARPRDWWHYADYAGRRSRARGRDPIGTGCRNLLRNNTRKQELERRNSGAVGKVVRAQEPPGPAWDNINAREAGSRSEQRLAQAGASKQAAAARCHPRSGSPGARSTNAKGGRPPWARLSNVGNAKVTQTRPPAAAPLLLLVRPGFGLPRQFLLDWGTAHGGGSPPQDYGGAGAGSAKCRPKMPSRLPCGLPRHGAVPNPELQRQRHAPATEVVNVYRGVVGQEVG